MSAWLSARAELNRVTRQLEATVEEHLDRPSAATRSDLRTALSEFKAARGRLEAVGDGHR